MKRSLILLLAVCALGEVQAQGGALDKAPWNNHAWSVQDVAIPLLREAIDNINNIPDTADLLIEEARKHLGKPYHYGGKGPKVFDCAGFARYVYMQFGYVLPEVADKVRAAVADAIEVQVNAPSERIDVYVDAIRFD